MIVIKNMLRVLIAWMESGRLFDLISTRHHSPYLTRHRLATLVTRVRLVAVAFSALTLAWIPFDVATLSPDIWRPIVACRVLAAVIFLLLAILPNGEQSRTRALMMLGIILALPLTIYGVSEFLLAGQNAEGLAAINGNLYRALPLVVLAGLSIFPLVASEGLLIAIVIAAVVTGVQVELAGIKGTELLTNLWVLMLALGVYLLACAIQLHYMMALLRQASHDPLTGAMTRRSGVDVLDLYFRLACDQDAPLTVLFIDADNFKSINDNFGHDAGDQALKEIATRLHAFVRQADIVMRWGGEEFVVIMNNTPITGAGIVVNRIMNDWFGKRPDGAPLTASMGLAERKTDGVTDWPQLIALADERMYAAKTAGKARCVGCGASSEALATSPA